MQPSSNCTTNCTSKVKVEEPPSKLDGYLLHNLLCKLSRLRRGKPLRGEDNVKDGDLVAPSHPVGVALAVRK